MSRGEIGGYLPLDLPRGQVWHPRAVGFNTARSALMALLRGLREAGVEIRRLWLPTFNCSDVEISLRGREPDLPLRFYSINEGLEPVGLELDAGDLLYRVNLFGLKPENASPGREGVIVDNVHAYFQPPQPGAHTLYSARKFFGVPDGAHLYSRCPVGFESQAQPAWERSTYLLKRHDVGASPGHGDFTLSERALAQAPIAPMSALAARLLEAVDYHGARTIRLDNFRALHAVLASSNGLSWLIDEALSSPDFVPLTYPLLRACGAQLRRDLVQESVFCPMYWATVAEASSASAWERRLATDTVHLPVDQRYGAEEMKDVLGAVQRCAPSPRPG